MAGTFSLAVSRRGLSARFPSLAAGLPLLGTSWGLLWTVDTFWNPLFFTGLWVGAALVMYAAGQGHPGIRRHLLLIALSIPLWWWFEFVNWHVLNWEYVGSQAYGGILYVVFGSLPFSTVIAALHAAWGIGLRAFTPGDAEPGVATARWYGWQAALGISFQALIFLFPTVFFPLVWVALFLVLDAIVGYQGGRSLVQEARQGEWRLLAALAIGGLLCGFLWEFWNFWAVPKWEYEIPWLGFAKIFEMPLLGYGGYVPFSWSVYQLLQVRPLRRWLGRDWTGLLRPAGSRR